MGWNRLRTYALVAALALLSTLVVVPAFGADGDDPVDAVEFTAVDGTAKFLYDGSDPQVLTTNKNGCDIQDTVDDVSTETLLDLAGVGGPPGLNDLSIGIKTNGKNANGTPCSQIDGKETLTIQPGSELDGVFWKVRLDLEVTKDAVVLLTLSDGRENPPTFTLKTGTNANPSDKDAPFEVSSNDPDTPAECAAATSSGPNSHANDNCIWTVEPGFDFDTIELTIDLVSSPDGTVSLEGGSDTGLTTLFYVANRLNCDKDKLFEGTDEPTYKVRPENGGLFCEKDFTYDAGVDALGNPFVKLVTSNSDVSGERDVVFLELLELEPQVFPGPAQTPSLYYDDDFSDGIQENHLAPFCLVDPRDVDENGEPIFDLAAAYDSAAEADDVLPTDETTCIISAEFVTVGFDVESGKPLVKPTYYKFNKNDGFRTFK